MSVGGLYVAPPLPLQCCALCQASGPGDAPLESARSARCRAATLPALRRWLIMVRALPGARSPDHGARSPRGACIAVRRAGESMYHDSPMLSRSGGNCWLRCAARGPP